MPNARRIHFGPDPDQFMDLCGGPPEENTVLALVHGGFWRHERTLDLMHPVAGLCADNGWPVANIEYRRTGDGRDIRWPVPLTDVSSALEAIAKFGAKRIVAVGHSAGGQLALEAAAQGHAGGRLVGVVALAPVTDLQMALEQNLGEGAVRDLMPPGSSDGDLIERSNHLRRSRTPTLLVHGSADTRVPVEQSRTYARDMALLDAPLEYVEYANEDHFFVLNPHHEVWRRIFAWASGLT